MSGRSEAPWSVRFRRDREATWQELERLVARCHKAGPSALQPAELQRLPVLYRATLSALGVARGSLLDKNLLAYLESLVARAYLVVYAPKRSFGAVFSEFVQRGFPRAVRSIAWPVVGSAVTLLVGGAVGFAVVTADMDTYYLFLSHEMAGGRDPASSTEALRETLFSGGKGLLEFTAFLFVNNASVSILCYGLGFLLGLPVLLLLLYNGMILGAMTALFHSRGLAVEWWSWILPHGVSELTAIVFAGAAGLAVGARVVFPGRYSRLVGLADVGRRMGAVVGGAVLMLVLAAVVEGVFRQTVQSLVVRYVMAGVFGGLWCAYFFRAGRAAAPPQEVA